MFTCSKCGVAGKPRYNRNSYCKECRMAYLTDRRWKAKAWVDEIKAKTPCADCGNFFPAICMDFDHTGDKFRDISKMLQKYSTERILEEIAKCEVVCSNCHRLRTAFRLSQTGKAATL